MDILMAFCGLVFFVLILKILMPIRFVKKGFTYREIRVHYTNNSAKTYMYKQIRISKAWDIMFLDGHKITIIELDKVVKLEIQETKKDVVFYVMNRDFESFFGYKDL